MKERSVEEYYYPCRKHPSSSPVGICAYCLKDRLMKLVCSDCGEQRLSSCSCSDVSSYRNSVDVGSVGRISFLIENDEQSKDDAFVLRRSNSCVAEVKKKNKKSNGFWRIGNLFSKKKRERNIDFDESWAEMDVSRCRSVCSFRGDHDMAYNSSAKISDFNESEPRKSGFRMDLESSAKETSDDSGFIDLKLDESKTPQHFVFKNQSSSSSSCRITVNERGIKKGGHGKVWKWIFKQHSAGKKDLHHIFESSSRSDR